MKVKFVLCLIVLSLACKEANSIKFFFDVPVHSHKCIGEYLTGNTVAIFSVQADQDKIAVNLFDPNGTSVYEKVENSKVKIAFTASESGNHQLCIVNKSSNATKINFEFLTGVAAKDYSDIAKKSNIKPVELNLQKLEDMVSYLIRELSNLMLNEEHALNFSDTLSNKIIMFSLITLVSMIFIGLFETIFIQKYLQRRKII